MEITAAAAGAAVAVSAVSNLAMGSTNFQSIWTILNTFQLVIVIALLDIEYPTKVEAFMQGFELAALSMPE